MPASNPAVSISVESQDTLTVTLTNNRGETLPVESDLTLLGLDEYRKRLYQRLQEFWECIGYGLRIDDFERISEAMGELHKAGRLLSYRLFNDELFEVENFFRRSCPTWLRCKPVEDPPLVEDTSKIKHPLPLEYFPIFNHITPPHINNIRQLACVAARFLGFSAILKRSFGRHHRGFSDSVLDNPESLGIRFFQHSGFEAATKEREFLEGHPNIDFRGPWPSEQIEQYQFVPRLASQLWDASSNSRGTTHSLDQIQHFACHCDTMAGDTNDYALYLAHKTRTFRWFTKDCVRHATIEDLDAEFSGLPPKQRKQSKNLYPLVFLNACGGSKLTPTGVTSFPHLFLTKGHRGVISTETSIPDLPAAAFSKQFYANLFSGCTLGQAMYRSRWSLLTHYQNPLGILYTAYANPDLRVREPDGSCSV